MTEMRTTFLPPTESWLENGNRTHWDGFQTCFLYPYRVLLIMSNVTLLICPFGLVGNGLVFWFLSFRIKRNPFTIYVLNLAAADFGFLLCLALSRIMIILDCMHIFLFFELLLAFTFSASLSLLTAISAERCVSVLFPIWHRCHRPKHLSVIICALLWAVSSLVGGLRAYVCFSDSSAPCRMMLLQLTSITFFVFIPIAVLSSLMLNIKVRKSSLRRQPRKLYIAVLLNVLFFLLLVAPYSIGTFFLSFLHLDLFVNFCLFLASINSSINPVIYFLVGSYRNKKFRGSVKKALRRVFEEEADNKEERVRAISIPMATNVKDPVMG